MRGDIIECVRAQALLLPNPLSVFASASNLQPMPAPPFFFFSYAPFPELQYFYQHPFTFEGFFERRDRQKRAVRRYQRQPKRVPRPAEVSALSYDLSRFLLTLLGYLPYAICLSLTLLFLSGQLETDIIYIYI